MTLRFAAMALLVATSVAAFAQTKEKIKKVARPDFPGTFTLDLGLVRGAHIPANFKQGFEGSRTLNFYYQYPLRIPKTRFSFNPGVGLGFDRFKMVNNYTLNPVKNGDGTYDLVDARGIYPGAKKSMIVTDYLDIPVDFRYDSRPEDRARSFFIAAGGRFGVLYNGFTKIKYSEDGETKMIKDKQNHGINPIRYGVYGRVGAGGFNMFVFYNLSPFFAPNKGPESTKMSSLTIGISITGL